VPGGQRGGEWNSQEETRLLCDTITRSGGPSGDRILSLCGKGKPECSPAWKDAGGGAKSVFGKVPWSMGPGGNRCGGGGVVKRGKPCKNLKNKTEGKGERKEG